MENAAEEGEMFVADVGSGAVLLDEFVAFEAQLLDGDGDDAGQRGVVIDVAGISNDTGEAHLARMIMDWDFATALHDKLTGILTP